MLFKTVKSCSYLVAIILLQGCLEPIEQSKNLIGYIDPDHSFYSKGFETCSDTVLFNANTIASRNEKRAGYYGGSRAIKRHVDLNWDSSPYDDSGYLTFRFIMNCKAEVGRFKIEELDLQFEECKFNKKLVNELLGITAKMENWRPLCFNDENKDVNIFLTYKLEDGEIVEILP